ncbi:MAG: phosphatidate cytidylyltransferase [Anaerolineae bacterium]|nr:phosphatidate cytidylyltransferase [Anaerolineae bacterium]
MLKTRALVAVVALPVLIVVVWTGGWVFSLVVLAALLIGADEYVRLWRRRAYCPPGWLVLGLIALAWAATWFEEPDWWQPGLSLLMVGSIFFAVWRMESGDTDTILNVALAVFGGVYLGWLGSTLVAVRLLDEGAYLTLFLYGCVVIADSAAYFVGRQWGRHKLSPTVSPKKSWEGYLGGIAGAAIFGTLAGGLPESDVLTAGHGALIGLLIGITGTVGDLGISAIKRQVGAKDSSNLIPGHGGLLDRTDSVLIAAVVGYYYLVWFVL